MTVLAHVHGGAGSTAGAPIAIAVLVLHVVAAGTWLAGVGVLVLRRISIARVAPILTVAAATTIATGLVNTCIHIEAPALLTHRAYGWVFIAKLGFVAAALLLARVVRRSGRRVLLRLEAGALVAAGAAGISLAVLPPLTSVLPGFTVVATATGDPECLSQIHGAFAAVHEQRPTSTLRFLASGQPVPAGAVRVPDCVPNSDGGTGLGPWLASTLARTGSRDVEVIVDQDPRGRALAARLHATVVDATVNLPSLDGTVIVATSWDYASAVLGAARSPTRRVILAPWLLRRTLLAPAVADLAGGQISVVTDLDPTGTTGTAYIQALARVDGTLEPTAAGLIGYRNMRNQLRLGVQTLGPAKLFTPANLAFLPPELQTGHNHTTTSGWLADGDLAPIT